MSEIYDAGGYCKSCGNHRDIGHAARCFGEALIFDGNTKREPGRTHQEWHAPCGCAFHLTPFPHVHPCSEAHKRPDLHAPVGTARHEAP